MIIDLKLVPNNPGVYQFYSDKEIIYIGKAKNLKKRVRSYFTKAIKDRKTELIKRQAIKIETFSTSSETEALILEQQLIKEHKPKFNILLKDDKTYPYIFFASNHKFPSISLRRSKQPLNKDYYGPLINANLAKTQIKELQKIFKLRNCADSTFATRSRPCIEYQMKRCSAPCVSFISKEDYQDDISSAKQYLTAEKRQIRKILLKKMQAHADKLEFEDADRYSKMLKTISAIEDESGFSTKPISLDIWHATFAVSSTGIAKVSVKEGRAQDIKTYYLQQNEDNNCDEMFRSVLFHYYQYPHQLPPKIYIANNLDESILLHEAFQQKFSTKIQFLERAPKNCSSFIKLAKLNSNQSILNQQLKEPKHEQAFIQLDKICSIKENILNLECIDISHHAGAHPRAGLVHFTKEGPVKANYRHYKIPEHLGGDDVGSMAYALNKRLQLKNVKPMIILIDGGKHQLNAVKNRVNSTHVYFLAIEKGSKRKSLTETIYSIRGNVDIPSNSELFKFLTLARDEAHRFAVKSSRLATQKSIQKSILDKIPGIGPVKKRTLIKHFKNISILRAADIEDLIKIPTISLTLAKRIKYFLWQNEKQA